jgi:hypothetical protein
MSNPVRDCLASDDLVSAILGYTSLRTLVACEMTCRHFRDFIKTCDSLWEAPFFCELSAPHDDGARREVRPRADLQSSCPYPLSCRPLP